MKCKFEENLIFWNKEKTIINSKIDEETGVLKQLKKSVEGVYDPVKKDYFTECPTCGHTLDMEKIKEKISLQEK